MARNFQRLSRSEATQFLADRGIRRAGPHRMTKRIFHWPYCARCGLVALKNDATRRALRAQCVTYE